MVIAFLAIFALAVKFVYQVSIEELNSCINRDKSNSKE